MHKKLSFHVYIVSYVPPFADRSILVRNINAWRKRSYVFVGVAKHCVETTVFPEDLLASSPHVNVLKRMKRRTRMRRSRYNDVIKFNLYITKYIIFRTNERINLLIVSRSYLFNRFRRRVFDWNTLNVAHHNALISTRTCKEGSNSRAMSLTLADSPSTFHPRRSVNEV